VPVDGESVPYTDFVAPALLATSAMNGAIFDSTFNVFFKIKYMKTYDAVLATRRSARHRGRRGRLVADAGADLRHGLLVVMLGMGLVHSWWALLALPPPPWVGFCFAGLASARPATMRSWQDFEFIQLVTLPMFLFLRDVLSAFGVFAPRSARRAVTPL